MKQTKETLVAKLTNPHKVMNYILNHVYLIPLRLQKGLTMKGNTYLHGRPLIIIRRGARIVIGDKVLLNSSNRTHHINMHSPVKLMADKENAFISIGDNSFLHGACIHAWKRITIGRNCLIAANCQIFDCSGHDLSFEDVERRVDTDGQIKPVAIGDNVWICANSIILPGVTIGAGSVIAAGSVVTRDIPPFVLAGGNPAKIIHRYEQHQDLSIIDTVDIGKMPSGVSPPL
jgi:acetyltransferase-like isoleucine patch superfamily enzyme